MNNEYKQFRELLKGKKYGEAAIYLIKNSNVKEIMNNEELLTMLNYYEKDTINFIVNEINETNKNIAKLNSNLEKTLKKIGEIKND